MSTLHEFFKNAILIYLTLCAIWGLASAVRGRSMSDSYRTALLIAEGLFVVQAVVGVALLLGGKTPPNPLHYLYGFVGLVVLPSVIGFVGRGKTRDSLWLGLTCLFLVGIALRAWTTGVAASA
jgi:heme A synthase